ncbi:DUF2336 domain-containing protein [Rhizobium sp. S152]|nr:DUF2336 domain-containing protein [Rhizobium sp. S152]MDM9627088.1 DUF2336 domain-containing protein [Rhizobium sp. S152]
MATVSSFEGLQPPTRSELRQFAELFTPLFQASSDEAKRQAVAALSQCPQIPPAVALFVGCQPIEIAAPFLIASPAIDDDTLIAIARIQGTAHMRAIVSRETLSPRVIDALVGLRQAEQRLAAPVVAAETVAPHALDIETRTLGAEMVTPVSPAKTETTTVAATKVATAPVAEPVKALVVETAAVVAPFAESQIAVEPAGPVAVVTNTAEDAAEPTIEDIEAEQRRASEQEMREKIRDLARHVARDDADRLGLRTLSSIESALLVRFARSREAALFAKALSNALATSRWLAERVMLDLSGHQLATTLVSLGMDFSDAVFVLERLYPHLAEAQHSVTRAWILLDQLDQEECNERVEAWRRADSYTYSTEEAAPPATHRNARQIPPARDIKVVGRAR